MQNEAKLDLITKYDSSSLHLAVAKSTIYYTIKRIMDVIVAFGLLVLFFPLMLLITLVITVFSPGPVFFSQERVGVKRSAHGGRPYWKKTVFQCIKFRTMHVNTDSSLHRSYIQALIDDDHETMVKLQGKVTEIHKLLQDPRVTRPGKLLRKLSLDELPQLWNVLRGDMSIVGPRPAIPYEVEMYKSWHLLRLGAQPGITGLQQVVARSTASFDKQVELDLEYINHQSIWLDFRIMLKTPFVIISTKGAE